MYELTLFANAVWFSLGFYAFSVRNHAFARLLTAPEHHDAPLFPTLAASGRFLGGLNLAFAAFSTALLLQLGLFPEPAQRALFLAVFALAHGTQFLFNLPIALANTRGGGVWPVLEGLMLLIFAGDALLSALNLTLAVGLSVCLSY